MDRMVAAYLIGGTTPAKIPGIQPSRSATDTGVMIGWIGGSYTKMGDRPLVQVNPLSWELNGPEVPV